jgi:hypothetical protein
MTTERYIVTLTNPDAPAQVFAVLADPVRHHDTEPGDWVRDSKNTTRITSSGQVFGMNMYLERAGGHYVTENLVNVFEKDRAIGWMPGTIDDDGHHNPGGWSWRYDLSRNGDGTDVTLTYDWSGTPQAFREQVGGMPVFAEDYLEASLAALERCCG